MGNVWEAEFELEPEAAQRLIETQFPILAPAYLEHFGTGWDNIAYLVNGTYVFRFPRRTMGVGLIEREIRILPLLAPHLPLPIPAPRFAGSPVADYPSPFAGYRLIAGVTACRCRLSDADRARNAAPLARFLTALHHIPVDAETSAWAPGDEIERANLAKRAPVVKERLRVLAPELPALDVEALSALVDDLAATPPYTEPPCWVHGDLYPRHLLLDGAHDVCGVIDWGDVHLGDPALDLSIAFSFLPPEARRTFQDAYPGSEALWRRARKRALHYGAILSLYGRDIGDEAIRAAGEVALQIAAL